ncbi:uncharacterized protein I303_105750 [Kwoniella dejecticola CBS 10117]|uniref:Uncharacterized protein n=1 Tax=Kwoniella dejecticola CBS 10117 TaxID=1296121 RepID=A0A1A6A0B7_9TREE|nr:uncharacterized protein I303_05772 [Kwoniella dejecticola CBS 10117]OBR83493.1 hypothetical protein I303_05772 [Kwoniella dejecticola CBS 10117]
MATPGSPTATVTNPTGTIDPHGSATGAHDIEKGHRPSHINARLNEAQPGFPVCHKQRANPAPLGLFAFATTTLLFSLINAHARHVSLQNIAVGMSFALGGLAQFVAGIFEFCVGNTFGMTAFCGYGAFSFSVAISYWPSSGVLTTYAPTPADPHRLNAAIGLFLMCWFVFTFVLWLGTFRSSVVLCATFFFFWLSLLLLSAGYLANKTGVIKASGWMGIVTSLLAFYVGAHSFLTAEAAPIQLPNPSLARKRA